MSQVFYMLSRTRAICSVRPNIRAICNPYAACWLVLLIAWHFGQESHFGSRTIRRPTGFNHLLHNSTAFGQQGNFLVAFL